MFDSLLESLGLSGGKVVISAILVFLICLIAIKILMKAVEKLLARCPSRHGRCITPFMRK